MKTFAQTYIKLARGGFFNQSYKYFLLTIIALFIFAPKIGSDIEVIIFTFLALVIFSDLDARKYSLAVSLPIKVKTRIKMLYINTYVLCFLGSLSAQLAYLIRGEVRPVSIMVIIYMLSVVGCSICYLIFASSEFKQDPQEEVGIMIAFSLVLTIAGMFFIMVYFVAQESILGYLAKHSSITIKIAAIIISGTIMLLISQISYKRVVEETLTVSSKSEVKSHQLP